MPRHLVPLVVLLLIVSAGCQVSRVSDTLLGEDGAQRSSTEMTMQDRMAQYTTVRLTADLDSLSEDEREMVRLLIEASQIMDGIFWEQAYGDRDSLLASTTDADTRAFLNINYGPWDRLRGDEPFMPGFAAKPVGANFYPADITQEEFEAAAENNPELRSQYTLVRRNDAGELTAIPYSEAYRSRHEAAARLMRQAAALAPSADLQRYLTLRAQALLSNEYQASDIAWMQMRDNTIEFVVGPIENYEDGLFGAKAAHEAFVLIKDREWSQRLERYAALLPALQRGLPVPEQYRRETPGSDADLGAYDAVYYAGDANAGSKTIAINLPNDEEVQLRYGSRRLQIKNAMQAKFDEILDPLADVLIAEDQRQHVTFDAFFSNTMFHEVAHGLGIKNVIDGSGQTVREALREHYSALEEGKADVLGLYMVRQLAADGELAADHDLMDNYVTFVGSIFRSIRFGSASAHGRANLIRFNYFIERGAIERTEDGRYRVVREQFEQAVDSLSERILRLQGDGQYDAVAQFVDQYGTEGEQLRADLNRLTEEGIPIDVVFDQGLAVLGLREE